MGEPAKNIVGVAGHGHPSVITHDDPRWSCPEVIELVSTSFDRDLLGIGSSPYFGDVGALGVRVGQIPTPDQQHRFLIRLVTIYVARNRLLLVRGLRQYATIGGFPPSVSPSAVGVLSEFPIETPSWRFADGNISWHLRWEADLQSRLHMIDPAQLPGTSTSMAGSDTALLYEPPFPPYTPPGAGIPPGRAVEGLGTFYDMRFPWDEPHAELSIRLPGPGRLVYYASVHQTDPETRPRIFIPAVGVDVLPPEDQYVAGMEGDNIDIAYQRVAGALTVELFPCCA